jgi:Fic family protein
MNPMFQDLDGHLAEWKSLQPLKPEDEKRLWRKLLLDWNYHSNRIEGNTLTYGETELLLVHGTASGDHDLRQYNEMQAHDVAIAHVRAMAAEQRVLSEADIRDLNRILLKEPYWKEAITAEGMATRKEIVPGEYKTAPNSVRTASGEIFHYADPADVPIRMGELVSWLRQEMVGGSLHPLEIASKLHHDFVLIHPFDDGNGRTARLLVNYVLMRNGYLPLVVPTEKKDTYLAALRLADAGDLTSLTEHLASWAKISLERGIRAAKGESVEEPDDLVKEIELFKRRQGTRQAPGVQRSPAVLRELCASTILPLFDDLVSSLAVLNDLFSDIKIGTNLPASGNWREAVVSWGKKDDPMEDLAEDLIHLSYKFSGFKGSSGKIIEAEVTLYVHLSTYYYAADFHYSPVVKRPYSDPLDERERKLITKEALDYVFRQIKRASGEAP